MRSCHKRLLASTTLCLLLPLGGSHSLTADSAALPYAAPVAAISPQVEAAVAEAVAEGEPLVDLALAAPDAATATQVAEAVAVAGGQVLDKADTYLQVQLPPAVVTSLVEGNPALAVSANQAVGATLTEGSAVDQPMAGEAVQAGAAVNLGAIGLPVAGLTGEGVTVAVIDSGIDPGHADLQTTAGGRAKLVDWKDFTGEGWVALPEAVAWAATYTASDGRVFTLPAAPWASQGARFGYWEESKVPGRINRDLDRNGLPLDRFGVLAVDSQRTGVYDMVYVDTNNDGSFTDEQPLRSFAERGDVARLGRHRFGAAALEQLAFVVAELDPAGTWVSLGFDSLGHGTQVAGVLAGSGDGMVGVAPGAQLMALKVVTSQNTGSWFAVENAVRYAAQQGAQIINISLGGLPVAARSDSAAAARLNQIAAEYDVLIVLATDNTGPGLSSGSTLGSPWEVMAVGAYYSPAMWQRDYGYVVPAEGVWWNSGMGPRSDGAYLPNLIAPGGSPTTSPRWLHNTGYTTAIGTSIAAPHAAGAAALLLQGARQEGLAADHRALRLALEESARPLVGYPANEQGRGLLQLPRALAALRQLQATAVLAGREGAQGEGLLAREYRPANGAFYLTNRSQRSQRYTVSSSAGWVTSPFESITLPPGVERRLDVQMQPPATPGVHTAQLELTPEGGGYPTRLPITYVRPVTLNQGRFATDLALPVTRYQRYFVTVEPGAGHLLLDARSLTGADGLAVGRFQVQVFGPDGQMLFQSGPVGAGGEGLSTEYYTEGPMAGVWEVVVTALPDAQGTSLEAKLGLELAVSNPPFVTPRRFVVEPGRVVTVDLPVFNPGHAIFARVKAVGLAKAYEPHLFEVKSGLNLIDQFELPSRAGALLLESSGIDEGRDDLTLWLYRFDPTRGWVPYWWGATRTTSGERMELFNVPAGRYQVYMAYNGSRPPGLRYQYRRSIALDDLHLSTTEETRWREPGAEWTIPLTIVAPYEPGLYYGHALVIDTDSGETATWIPIEVSVGEPALSVQPLVSRLTQGQEGMVTLEVRDGETGELVDGVITVDGKRYQTRQGQVAIAVTPWEGVQTLTVEARLPGYQPFRQELRVPVQQRWEAQPTGGESSPAAERWRERLEALLP